MREGIEIRDRRVADRVQKFPESVIREMTRIAALHGAVNLAQGYPDFEPPKELTEAAKRALDGGYNQYSVTWGARELRDAIARRAKAFNGIDADPESNLVVTCGSTEAMMAAMLSLINDGDEAVIFEPFYENYGPDAIVSGARPRYVRMAWPAWTVDEEALKAAFTDRTKVLILNTPNNPTGKVFTRDELRTIADLCADHDVVAVTDEIYEHIVFDGVRHVSLATIGDMAERTITINGLSKTYSATGWRIGWAIAPKTLADAMRRTHDFLTVGAPHPLQIAAVAALGLPESFYADLARSYQAKRDFFVRGLQDAGLEDLGGAIVLPGFIDAHTHMADSAGERGWTRLDATRDLADAVRRLRKAAASTPLGDWVVGTDWDEAKWPERRFLLREDLDRASTDHPVVARRIDCHLGSLNSKALELASDLAGTRGFEVDASGRPTGVLTEDAFGEFHRRFETNEAGIRHGLPAIARMAHRLGITSIHDVVTRAGWTAYQRARSAGTFRLRVYAMPHDSMLAALVNAGLGAGFGDSWLRLGAIKVFADGSLGAYTAALAAPYVGRPGERGILVHSPTELRSILTTAHGAGFQTATHAIGDAAIRLAVETLEAVQDAAPRKDPRHRIEHYELPDDEVLRRTKTAGIVASCQPNFVGQWSGPGG